MSSDEKVEVSPKAEFINGLKAQLQNPVHLRLLGAYAEPDPVASMEAELAAILLEVVRNED